MSDDGRTVRDVKSFLRSWDGFDSQQMVKFYDGWAETYEQDTATIDYRAPVLAADFLKENYSGRPEEAQVLDVACGSGLGAKEMFERGFRHFVGVDGSKVMLQKAAETGLYQDLRLALLGTEPLPAQTGAFDVVILAGALDVGFVPVSVVRELCSAAKPGGLICMSRGDHTQTSSDEYRSELERELQLMEDEGLWRPAGRHQADRYMKDIHGMEERYIGGTVYLYKKSVQ